MLLPKLCTISFDTRPYNTNLLEAHRRLSWTGPVDPRHRLPSCQGIESVREIGFVSRLLGLVRVVRGQPALYIWSIRHVSR
uniref:Uncharacterized protein n=1 Tax=Arundo donax TaxID=35708 RepID=A0A0A9HXW2_ARUDO